MVCARADTVIGASDWFLRNKQSLRLGMKVVYLWVSPNQNASPMPGTDLSTISETHSVSRLSVHDVTRVIACPVVCRRGAKSWVSDVHWHFAQVLD